MGLKNSILFTLADGRPHNAAEICDQQMIMQDEMQGIISELREDGLVIEEMPEEGMLVWKKPFQPFNELDIRQQLSEWVNNLFARFEIHYSLNSTNDFLISQSDNHPGVCIAERQTQGKGRNGRVWVSPAGQNLYLSISWCFEQVPKKIQILSLLSAVAVARVLRQQGYASVAVKWPNDIYLGEKKLGGILLETRPAGSQGLQVVIGIGLNIAMQNSPEQIDQPWTALVEVDADAAHRRSSIVAALLEEITVLLQDFRLASLQLGQHWPDYDLTRGRQVRVITITDSFTGKGDGIDDEGHFRLATSQGIKSFSSADISLRLY